MRERQGQLRQAGRGEGIRTDRVGKEGEESGGALASWSHCLPSMVFRKAPPMLGHKPHRVSELPPSCLLFLSHLGALIWALL